MCFFDGIGCDGGKVLFDVLWVVGFGIVQCGYDCQQVWNVGIVDVVGKCGVKCVFGYWWFFFLIELVFDCYRVFVMFMFMFMVKVIVMLVYLLFCVFLLFCGCVVRVCVNFVGGCLELFDKGFFYVCDFCLCLGCCCVFWNVQYCVFCVVDFDFCYYVFFDDLVVVEVYEGILQYG